MSRIYSPVQIFSRGRWRDSEEPRWVIQEDLCKNFPLCIRKIPSRKIKKYSRCKHAVGYCTDECYEKYKDKVNVRQQKLNDFLKEANSHD